MTDIVELLPCRECAAPCRVEHFGPSEYIEGTVSLWVCSNHKRFGGDCPSDLAYLDAEAWNNRVADEVMARSDGEDDQDTGCPPHCCCCDHYEPCCDCGRIMPSKACIGERCFCGLPAAKKVGEEILFDDPNPDRHNLTRYVCAKHYAELMGPLGAKQVGLGE